MPDEKRRPQVIMLPGGVLPALAYEALLKELGDEVHAVTKELDVYMGDRPPAGYTLDVEVAGIVRCAEEVGFDLCESGHANRPHVRQVTIRRRCERRHRPRGVSAGGGGRRCTSRPRRRRA